MKHNRILSALLALGMAFGGVSALPEQMAAAGNFTRASVHDPSIVKLQDGGY